MAKAMGMATRNSQVDQVRLFQHEWLERLSRISPAGFALLWSILLPLIAWQALGTATMLAATGLVFGGLAIWALFEYAMHRYLFHWQPRAAVFRHFVYLMHGNHHAAPSDGLRNLMPPVVSLPISGTIWALCVAALGAPGTWVFLGFITGYVLYDITHYACHQWPMKGRLGRMLKRHHMRHHHVREDGNYAITALFLDRWFGTAITSLKKGD
jgi:4-hydroxysphinganine ceramide fatty acyl 2-hydroxylase